MATLLGKTRELKLINAALLLLAGTLVVAGACSVGPEPATVPEPPTVDAATLWMDTVERGDLVIERRGAGTILDTDDGELYVEIRIPETQSLDIEIGQAALVDTRREVIAARVTAMADRIQQGVRLVTLEFTDGRPERVLPGMSIDATVEIGVVTDTLFVGKPAYGQSNSRVGLFKLDPDTGFAERVAVRLGASSVNMIEVLEGLEEGDTIILSDMSRWDAMDRVALR